MNTRLSLVLGLAFFAGCSSGPPTSEPPPASDLPTEGVTEEQVAAFRALEASTAQTFDWVQDVRLRTPKHLGGSRTGMPVLGHADPGTTTLTLLRQHRALFNMREPERELSLERSDVDELGMTHVRFQQISHGVPVAGSELAAHYDDRGRLAAIQANYIPGLDELDVNPTLTPEAALAAAKSSVFARSAGITGADLEVEPAKLVIFARGEAPPRLAFEQTIRVNASDALAIWIVTVDAKTGEVIDMLDNLQFVTATSPGALGDMKSFEVSPASGGFVMSDATSGVSIETYTAKNEASLANLGDPVTSTSLNEWDRVPAGAGSAVDAHVHALAVRNYYRDKHDRNGLDGVGSPMLSTVHVGKNLENAFWNGRGMLYGDGGDKFRPLAASLDVVGHEFTHGVTERTSALLYRDQSGALNEAVSDIMGAFVEHAVAPDDEKNWLLGEAIMKTGPCLRNMKDPTARKQPAAMSQYVNTIQDNGGVHSNSGIINNAAYLMTVGGTNPATKVRVAFGIGWEKSEKLWYRANTKYFLQKTDFGQAAVAVLTATEDLGFSGRERNIVACAFRAVGILRGDCVELLDPNAPATENPPTDTPTQQPSQPTGDAGASEAAPPRKKKTSEPVAASSNCNAASTRTSADLSSVMLTLVGLVALGRRARGRRCRYGSTQSE
ncbi:MAG TPA: M4 family metallopeptidase [Labilithrix sp.]|nr:M4 family metallopeptidase [Labilithrix sp.]